jgi:hypothetical protein
MPPKHGSIVALVLLALPACSQESIGTSALTVLSKGVVNDPRNKSLRFDILEYGLDRFCQEMTRQGAPLKLEDDSPVLGRFFAVGCNSKVVDDEVRKSFVVQFDGKGYAWTNVSQRMGFTSAGLIEYAPDFQLHDEAMYVYFRPKNIDAIDFATVLVESRIATAGATMLGVDFDAMGRNIVRGQLQRGFTVTRYDESGETDFGLGYVPVGQRPFRPFKVKSTGRVTLANDRTEVHTGQHDFVGAFVVEDDDQALYLTMTLDGAPGIDVLVVQKGAGDLTIDRYLRNPGPGALTSPPLLDETLVSGVEYRRYLDVKPGSYYLVLDHSTTMGRTAPPGVAGDDRAAKVDYIVQLGDSP